MSFAKHPRTLVIPQSNNAAAIRLSIAVTGIFTWILLCSFVIAEEPGKSVLRSGKTARVKVVVEAQGSLQLKKAKENESVAKPLPMKAIGTLTYDEVAVAPEGQDVRVARYYHEAEAQISVSERPLKNGLREDRRFVFCEVSETDSAIYSTTGGLTRDELELVTVPANSAVIDELLPKEVSQLTAGHEWQHSDTLLARLLNLHAVTANDVKSKVAKTEADLIRMEIGGKVVGSVDGVLTDLEISGKYNFSNTDQCITWLAMTIKEDRSVGPTAPGFQVEARVRVAIEPNVESSFAGQATQTAVNDQTAGMQLLEFEPQDSSFALMHGRKWHVISEQPKFAVLRMVEEGQTIAQCNIREISALPKEKQSTLESFKLDVVKGIANAGPQIVSATESTNPAGVRIYRVQVAGNVSNAAVQWIYHLAIDKDGRGVSYVFTMASDLAEQFGAADLEITATLRFKAGNDTPAQLLGLSDTDELTR